MSPILMTYLVVVGGVIFMALVNFTFSFEEEGKRDAFRLMFFAPAWPLLFIFYGWKGIRYFFRVADLKNVLKDMR